MNIKRELYSYCQDYVKDKLKTIEDTIKSSQNALESETKSSAGDKHETGRAMLQLEMEKAGQQLKVVSEMKLKLDRLDIDFVSKNIRLGSVVFTSQANYFIAISSGKIEIDKTVFFAISSDSPIGKLLLGKEVNDEVVFREQPIRIENIL